MNVEHEKKCKEAYKKLCIELCGVCATAKKSNTDEWMEYFAERVNECLTACADPSRVVYERGEIAIANAHPHGRAPARTVQGVVGSLDSGKGG